MVGVHIFLNNGTSEQYDSSLINLGGASGCQFRDIDLDEDLDILVTDTAGIWWFENQTGNADFAKPRLLVEGLDLVNVADVNGDGYQDLLVLDWGRAILLPGVAVTTATKEVNSQVRDFHLVQNYPNPFNLVTTIRYELPERSDVQITVYNLLGKEVTTLVSETQEAGYKSIQWDATNVAS